MILLKECRRLRCLLLTCLQAGPESTVDVWRLSAETQLGSAIFSSGRITQLTPFTQGQRMIPFGKRTETVLPQRRQSEQLRSPPTFVHPALSRHRTKIAKSFCKSHRAAETLAQRVGERQMPIRTSTIHNPHPPLTLSQLCGPDARCVWNGLTWKDRAGRTLHVSIKFMRCTTTVPDTHMSLAFVRCLDASW